VSIGRGGTGLLSNLRPFSELVDDSAADRRPILDFWPGIEMVAGSWVLGTSNTWSQRAHFAYNRQLLDVVGVETMVDPRPLVRAETLTLCQATPGTFFYDPMAATLPPGYWWNDERTKWGDAGVTWGGSVNYTEGVLHVHLPDDSNPNNTVVVALVGITIAGKGQVLPVLGPNKPINPSFDTWSGGTNAGDWVETSNVSQDTPLVGAGYAARMSGSIPATTLVGLGQSMAGVKNAHYLFAGYYWTDPLNPAAITARARIQNSAGVYLRADGRETDNVSSGLALANTEGLVRRFVFVYRCPATVTTMEAFVGAFNSSGGALSGAVKFDGLQLHRVWGYRYYEPRLSMDALPETEVTSPGIYPGEKTVGLGAVSILMGDGALDRALGSMLLTNRQAVVSVGGAFQDGQEVTRENYRTAFGGVTQRPQGDDEALRLEVEDANTFLRNRCPARAYSLKDDTNLYLNDEGYPRPYFWGINRTVPGGVGLDSIRCARIDKSASTAYGTYEVCDPAIALNGMGTFGVSVYPTEEDARKNTREYTLTNSTHFTRDQANCRFSIIEDVRNYRYDQAGNDVGLGATFDFDIGGGALVAALTIEGPASKVATDLQAAMNAAAGVGNITVTYSNTTHKFTVARGAGTLNLLPKTGANDQVRSWAILGFELDADRTGSLSYVGDNATFTDPDLQHLLRAVVGGGGYRDDALGTVTGSASLNIELPAHVAHHLLLKVGRVPPARINQASFRDGFYVDSGFTASPVLRVWLAEASTLAEALAVLERSSFSDIVIDGDGVVHFRPWAMAQVVESFFDRDYLSFALEQDSANVFKAARVFYGVNPNTGGFRSRDDTDAASAGVPVKYGRDEILEIKTFLREDQPVEQLERIGQRYAKLAASNPRVVTFQARSKLVDLLIGDKVQLTRARALTPTGRLDAATFRVRRLRHNYLTGVSTCTCVEDVPFLFSA
jgi:hypothetical protein